MARFVLVHGGFSGAWIWLPLMDGLKAAGHVVEAFDLPGMGDDHTSASEVSGFQEPSLGLGLTELPATVVHTENGKITDWAAAVTRQVSLIEFPSGSSQCLVEGESQ